MKEVCAYKLSSVLFLLLSFKGTVALVPAQPCNTFACQPPNCRCASTNIPGNVPFWETPQIVTLNFDDSFRVYDYEQFFSPLFNGRKNPNSCQIGVTFFNSHSYTDYSLVERAHHSDGYEFASHSVTHRWPTTWWATASEADLKHEILDQKTILSAWGGIPAEKVRGFRAPFLQTSENELKVLHKNGFLYEASMGSYIHYWPFTLDYKSPLCTSPATCPHYSYPGLWVVPNIFYVQSNGFPCSMLDACTAPITEDDWFNFLMDNFNLHYFYNRAPFGIHLHAAWFFLRPERVNAMRRFLDIILARRDVYIVTQSQAIAWVQNPTPLSQITTFEPWKCTPGQSYRCEYNAPPNDPRAPSCIKTFTNPIWAQFKSCAPVCPANYPVITNPLGN